MAPLQDRAARLDLSFPLRFVVEGSTLRGNCLNVSASGLLALFDRAPDLWTTGDLHLGPEEQSPCVPARVARTNDNETGLAFLFRGEADREAVRRLLVLASERSGLVGLPPF